MTIDRVVHCVRLAIVSVVVASAAVAGERTIEWEADVDAPVAAVWEANTTKDGIRALLSAEADVDWRVGGTIRIRTGSDASAEDFVTTILAYEPNRMVAMVEAAPPDSKGVVAPAWYVSYFEERSPSRTHLRFVEVSANDAGDHAEHERAFRRDNDAVLAKLREFLAKKPKAAAPVATPAMPRSDVIDTVVAAPIEEVWKAFTTKEGVESWMVPVADVDFRIAGTIRTNYDPKAKIGDPGTIAQHILAYEPQRMIAMRFEVPDTAPQLKCAEATWWVVTLTAIDATSTKVHFAHLGFGEGPEWDVAYRHFESGNAFTMRKLAERFEKSKR